jgi:hypothetical protein
MAGKEAMTGAMDEMKRTVITQERLLHPKCRRDLTLLEASV